MKREGLPAVPSRLTGSERTALQLYLDRLDRLSRPLHPLAVWDELSRAMRSMAQINVFYVASIDPARRTFSIEYIRHRLHPPTVGYVGVPFGGAGIGARMLRDPDTPYTLAEDDGDAFRSGLPYFDELDAKDAVAIGLRNSDGSLCSLAVVSSLSPDQFTHHFIDVLTWLVQVGRWCIETDGVAGESYQELGRGDQLNVAVTSLQAVRDALAGVLESMAKGQHLQAVEELRRMDALLMATQSRLSSVYSAETKTISGLSPRERQLLSVIARPEMLTNPQIAEEMATSVANVKKVLSTLLVKTGASNRQDLHRLASRWALRGEA